MDWLLLFGIKENVTCYQREREGEGEAMND